MHFFRTVSNPQLGIGDCLHLFSDFYLLDRIEGCEQCTLGCVFTPKFDMTLTELIVKLRDQDFRLATPGTSAHLFFELVRVI